MRVGFAFAWMVAGLAGSAGLGGRTFGEPYTMAKLNSSDVTESSGVAPALVTPGCYFTHNDSGDTARVFRFDAKGRVLAVYKVANAENVDWEDMASAKLDGRAFLFMGDIGDNASKRRSITVYRIPEPVGSSSTVSADAVYELTYPDGAHNAEALMIHPATGDLYIVTKTDKKQCQVFRLARPTKSGKFSMSEIGRIAIPGAFGLLRLVTGGAISPDARHVILRTYLLAYEFDVPARFDEWVKAEPRTVRLNLERQGEAVTYSLDGRRLVTTSEGKPCQVSAVLISGR